MFLNGFSLASLASVARPPVTVGHLASVGQRSSLSCPSAISCPSALPRATVSIVFRLVVIPSRSSALSSRPSLLARVGHPLSRSTAVSLALVGLLSRVLYPSFSRPPCHLLLFRRPSPSSFVGHSSSHPSAISSTLFLPVRWPVTFIVSAFSGARFPLFCHLAAWQSQWGGQLSNQ